MTEEQQKDLGREEDEPRTEAKPGVGEESGVDRRISLTKHPQWIDNIREWGCGEGLQKDGRLQ